MNQMLSDGINLKDIFYYDESSKSCLRWKVNILSGKNKIQARKGDEAGAINSSGYYCTSYARKPLKAHRIIWTILNGEIPQGMVIDHINQTRSDNRISNLRVVTRKVNGRNATRKVETKTGVFGVQFLQVRNHKYAVACVRADDTICRKLFSINKLGLEEAVKSAETERKRMIAELNKRGYGFSETHGSKGS